jgi:hypothetical protein
MFPVSAGLALPVRNIADPFLSIVRFASETPAFSLVFAVAGEAHSDDMLREFHPNSHSLCTGRWDGVNNGTHKILPERIIVMRRILPVLGRAAMPLVAAAFAVGVAGAPAAQATAVTADQAVSPAADVISAPPPPRWIRQQDCTAGRGHWIRDRRDQHLWHCMGGRWNGHDGRW